MVRGSRLAERRGVAVALVALISACSAIGAPGCISLSPPDTAIVDVSPTQVETYLPYSFSSVEAAVRAELAHRGQHGGVAVGDEPLRMGSGGLTARVLRVQASVLLLRVESSSDGAAHDLCRAIVSRLERMHYDAR